MTVKGQQTLQTNSKSKCNRLEHVDGSEQSQRAAGQKPEGDDVTGWEHSVSLMDKGDTGVEGLSGSPNVPKSEHRITKGAISDLASFIAEATFEMRSRPVQLC